MFDIRQDRPARRIQQALYSEQEHRHSRTLLEWQDAELTALWMAVNAERRIIGKGPIEIEKVRSVDQCASGHIDYVFKVALYCEELVYE